MQLTTLSLHEIIPDPENFRNHNERNLKIIADSLQKFGQYRAFVVQQSNRMIRIGNGMYEAMCRLKWNKPVKCVFLDLTDDMGKVLSILDNRASDLSCNDEVLLAEQLRALDDAVRQFCGFLPEEIDRMLNDTPIPVFREAVDPAAGGPSDTLFRCGDIIIRISRLQYDAWLEDLRLSSGMNPHDILTEIRRRLCI